MAPRTRSNRAEILARKELLARGKPFNITGLPALPNELYLEIISHIPAIPAATENPRIYMKEYPPRRLMLSALSQTCRSLRRIFLPYLWERLEVYAEMETETGQLPAFFPNYGKNRSTTRVYNKYAEELVRQLEVVTIRNPSLAEHVTVLNLLVTISGVKELLPELAHSMTLLPNIHTVQLNFGFNMFNQGLKDVFQPHVYPQVRTACVTTQAAAFLASCPNVKNVCSYLGMPVWNAQFNHMRSSLSTLEILGAHRFHRSPDLDFESILEFTPNLRDITLNPELLQTRMHQFKHLTSLRLLRTIRIRLTSRYAIDKPPDTEDVKKRIAWSCDILSKVPNNSLEAKQVVVAHHHGTTEVITV